MARSGIKSDTTFNFLATLMKKKMLSGLETFLLLGNLLNIP